MRASEPAEQGNNVTFPDRGNSSTYTLRRLKRHRPDLADQVARGSLSANAAAITAGRPVGNLVGLPRYPTRYP